VVSLLGVSGLLLDHLELKLPAERAKNAKASWIASTLQGVLLSQPDGLQPGALASAATTLEEATIGHRSLER
jgi:hypothetical protein